jgi:uncharacterized DUF497 family protein
MAANPLPARQPTNERQQSTYAICLIARQITYTIYHVITWDETKRQANIEKHGLDFVGAEEIFSFFMLIDEDDREAYGEQRWNAIGYLNGQIVHLTFVDHPDDEGEHLHFISLRKAETHEANRYYKEATAGT